MTARRVALGFAGVLAILYGLFPWLAAGILATVLHRWGIEYSRFDVGYPRWNGLDVAGLELGNDSLTVKGHNVHVVYRPEALLRGDLDSILIDELTIRVERAAAESPAPSSLALPHVWTIAPARRIEIGTLTVFNADPQVTATGRVSLDPDVLDVRLRFEGPLLAAPVDATVRMNPDGRTAVSLTEYGATDPFGSFNGVAEAASGMTAFDGALLLTGRPLALALAYAGFAPTRGSVQIAVRGRAPWPPPQAAPFDAIEATGDFRADLAGTSTSTGDVEARVAGTFTVARGVVKARVEPNGSLRGEIAGLRRFSGIDPVVALTTEGTVEIDRSTDELRIGEGLLVAVAVDKRPLRMRLRGAVGADRHFELAASTLDGTPVLLASGTPDAADRVAVKSRIALTGDAMRLAAAFGSVSDGVGRLIADFDGLLGNAQGDWLQNVSGKGRIDVALRGRIAGGPHFDTTLAGGYSIGDGIDATIEPGARIVLADAGVTLSTASALKVVLHDAPLRLNVAPVDLRLALQPIALGKRTLALDDARIAVQRLTLDGGALAAAAVLRGRAGRDALPLQITAAHDVSRATGEFSVTGDWNVARPLFATDLPKFDAPYDVDEGTVGILLAGRWNLTASPLWSARGNVNVTAKRAHYAAALIRDLHVDVPLEIDSTSYRVADTRLAIGSVDVGFALSDIALGFGVGDGVAHIHDLGGAVLGGRFSARPFDYEVATDRAALTVDLSGVSLAEVLALEGGDVQGSGTLDGALPVVVDGEDVQLVDGRVTARAPGGNLIYKGAAGRPMAARSGFEFAFRALENFQYDALEGNVSVAQDGALALGLRLRGRNPTVEQGRTIQFNVNVTEHLPALLASLRAADDIERRVEAGFKP